jgi:ADP-ribosylation factor-like protein 8
MFLTELFSSFLEWLKSIFFRQEMEVTVVGLQNSGKTTLVKVISVSYFTGNLTISSFRMMQYRRI